MSFSSGVFLYYFLPLFLLLYHVMPRPGRQAVLAVASYAFCAWWRPDFVLPLLFVTLVAYGGGLMVAPPRRRGWLWCLAVVIVLAPLAYFKYAGFAVVTLNSVLRAIGRRQAGTVSIILPVGLSFYTFKALSYLIDVRRGWCAPARGLLEFMSYVALFPQLSSGPIARFKESREDLRHAAPSSNLFFRGVLFFQVGFVCKVLVADTLGYVADQAFSTASLTFWTAWIGALAYAFQLFFDFSGYSDMAVGLGLMMGMRFPINFNRPYRAVSITDFWQRWHLTLSHWLRDYLFLPIAYALSRRVRDFRFLGFNQDYYVYALTALLTMTAAGLWHGAGWTFIVWGAYHGLWLALDRFWGKKRLVRRTPPPLRILATFVAVLVGWVVFRSASLTSASTHLKAMIGLCLHFSKPAALEIRPFHLLMGAVAAAWTWMGPATHVLAARAKPVAVVLLQLVFLIALLHGHFLDQVSFLYVQF